MTAAFHGGGAAGVGHLRDEALGEFVGVQEALMEHLPRAPCDTDTAALDRLERRARPLKGCPQLTAQYVEARALAGRVSVHRLIALGAVLRDGGRDGVVEASVQLAKVIRADGRVQFQCKFGDRLADVAIPVHYLRHRESLPQKVVPVEGRGLTDVRVGREAELQLVNQFIQKHGHAVFERFVRWGCSGPFRRLRFAPIDQLLAVYGDKCCQHVAYRKSEG